MSLQGPYTNVCFFIPISLLYCNQDLLYFFQVQPENQGKLVWLSGPPGAGKSTTGALMGKDAGYVYFEADCTMNGQNPFVSLDAENPTAAAFKQKLLKASNHTLKPN